jgi:hypothetical protein
VSLTAGQVLLRMPRGEVKTALLGRGWHGMLGTAPSPLTIVLVNGDTWRLEVFWIDKRRAKAVVRALTALRPAARPQSARESPDYPPVVGSSPPAPPAPPAISHVSCVSDEFGRRIGSALA